MLLEELARAPQSLSSNFTHEGSLRSLACGDELTVRAVVQGSVIQQISGSGHGCTVSMAALAALRGMAPLTLAEFSRLQEHYTAAVNGAGALDGDLEAFAGIGRFPLRAQCATLAWRALAGALAERD